MPHVVMNCWQWPTVKVSANVKNTAFVKAYVLSIDFSVTLAIVRYDPFIGLVVHRESGATICLHCRKAYLLSSIVEHFIASHKLAVFMKKYNMVVFNENDKIIPDRMESQLLELGAKRFIDHGFYIAPTQDPLPVIDVLKIERGYMCNYCPVFGQTSTAYFSPNLSTMNDHFSMVHAGMSNNQCTPCYIQHLYQDRDHLRYFRVECLDQEPIIPRIITTDLGQDNPQYYGSKRPFSSMVSGTPVQNLCYKKSSLYDLIKVKSSRIYVLSLYMYSFALLFIIGGLWCRHY